MAILSLLSRGGWLGLQVTLPGQEKEENPCGRAAMALWRVQSKGSQQGTVIFLILRWGGGRGEAVTHVVSRVWLIFAIIPREGSTLACMDDITPTTTISQLEGLAGNTPVMMPFWKDTPAVSTTLLRPPLLLCSSPVATGSWNSRQQGEGMARRPPRTKCPVAETLPGATAASSSCSFFFPNF